MTKLEQFLIRNNACPDGLEFAKNLTLEQFWTTCPRGDWILWLFAKMNPDSLRELTLAKGHCANTVRHLMKDKRSIKAVDVAIAFGEGRATREELDAANRAVAVDVSYAVDVSSYAAAVASYASSSAYASSAYAADAAATAAVAVDVSSSARKASQKLTADICRKYLPLEIWDQSKL